MHPLHTLITHVAIGFSIIALCMPLVRLSPVWQLQAQSKGLQEGGADLGHLFSGHVHCLYVALQDVFVCLYNTFFLFIEIQINGNHKLYAIN